ncbi:glutamate-rich WD repeat-containing protein 1-like [Dysidea avara]|uniref:glutamate-rich WD repeat-containing protein 1-like n=1 Tax=Dysidea avara TaxID=196820 RepID=UPI00332DB838
MECTSVTGEEEEAIYDDSESGGEDVEEMEEEEPSAAATVPKQKSTTTKVYLPGVSKGNHNIDDDDEGIELVHEASAYLMYHQAQLGAPCLSFDIVRDTLGDGRTDFPMTTFVVAGTQAATSRQDHVILVKMSQLTKTHKEDSQHDSDDDSSDSDIVDDEDEPVLDTVNVIHDGAVNRLRVAPLKERLLVATWSTKGCVHIWDMSVHMTSLSHPSAAATNYSVKGLSEAPLFSFRGHQDEGFALDWSSSGELLSGDCRGYIHLWKPQQSKTWQVDQRPFTAHSQSVEDIQWSPNEATVFASCSVDKTIRIWDVRAKPSKACMLTTQAHQTDINVISWNKSLPLIVSGGDDGIIKIWDLREFQKGDPVSTFKQHTAPITTLEWHYTDSTVFASAGEDNQLIQWDIAVEKDDITEEEEGIPPQLLFVHQGQKEIKELHWHPQIPGVLISTALTGFDVFRTISV